MHLQGNCELFRTYISENQDIWDDELKFDIYEAIRETVSYEHALIDYIDPSHIDNNKLKSYINYMADNALSELGMKKNYGTDSNPLPYMDDAVGTILTDFFSGAVTEYSKEVKGSWSDIKYSHWSKND